MDFAKIYFAIFFICGITFASSNIFTGLLQKLHLRKPPQKPSDSPAGAQNSSNSPLTDHLYHLSSSSNNETPTPINITSSHSVRVDTVLPRTTYFATKNTRFLKMTNTGSEIIIEPKENTLGLTTNGVFQNNLHKFVGARLIWNNKKGPAGSIVDGIGSPFEFIQLFIQAKYLTLDEAKKHRDGMVIVCTRIKVEGADNSNFKTFSDNYLQKIKEANKSVDVPQGIVTGWVFQPIVNGVSVHGTYYAYLGSYIDFADNRKQYYCATIIVQDFTNIQTISPAQFGIFSTIKNKEGKSYDTALTAADARGRTPVRAEHSVVIQDATF